tara:strand:+ start:6525 stop:9551 length:3027 start_codon:yes stop_codon:yes gene_type:complete
MSVKIELLEYVYEPFESAGQFVPNFSFTDTSNWLLGSGWSIASGKATNSGTSSGLENPDVSFEEGQTYRIKYKISGRTTGSFLLANHLAGGANGFDQSSNGEFIYDWVQGGTNTNKLSLYGWNSFDGSVEYAAVYPISNINWNKSILGELDITDSSDFPLALTFQISDLRDITSTSGDYSKTFEIPATKNNNNILKNLYTPNIVNYNSPSKNVSCRITFNGLNSVNGLLKVSGVGGYGKTPSYYNCIFYGSNLGWANLLVGKYMNTIDWSTYGDDIEYNKEKIMATWQHEHSGSSTSPIVYPITSYGDFNDNESTIQLLDTRYDALGGSTSQEGYSGWFNNGSPYGTPLPVSDWRPAVFVKKTLDNIFKPLGYTINSNFMNTDMFKKLVWLLPNFKYFNLNERYDAYAIETSFINGTTLTVPADSPLPSFSESGVTSAGNGSLDENDGDTFYDGGSQVDFDLTASNLSVNLDNGSYLDLSTNEITIGEYGYYNLKLSGLRAKVARAHKGGSDDRAINSIDTVINLEAKTVGQTSWNIIGQSALFMNPLTSGGSASVNQSTPSFTAYENLPNLELSSFYLNKGDKIKLSTGLRLTAVTNSQNFIVKIFFECQNSSYFNIEFIPTTVDYGQTYNLNDVINPDYKQVDFIKGVAHSFNLKMDTNESTKTINIEPYNDFFQPYASSVDWTYKLDRSKIINDKFMKSDLTRKMIFKYKSDNKDESVKYRGVTYFKDVLDEYPYQEELDSDFQKGTTTFENPFFAGTFNARDQDIVSATQLVDVLFSGCLWIPRQDNTVTWPYQKSRPPKGYDFLPRLLYWNKNSPTTGGVGSVRFAEAQTWTSTTEFIAANADADPATHLSIIYPQATSIDRENINSPILSYGNVSISDYDYATDTFASAVTGKGLYETYYRKMFEQFKQNPRVRTVYIDLKASDIVNLDFKKLIYIDGFYWRLNKISDFMFNKNESTKVELIEWLEVGIKPPIPASFIGTGVFGDVGTGIFNDPFGGGNVSG